MILNALGSTLPSTTGGPEATLEAALAQLEARGVHIAARSRWFRTAPVPLSDQPWFVNGVVRVETGLEPLALLKLLQQVELAFGRQRSVPNAARTLDIDIIDYDNRVENTPELTLPHPRMQDRAFVLRPMADIVPGWRHPTLGQTLEALISVLPSQQMAEPMGA